MTTNNEPGRQEQNAAPLDASAGSPWTYRWLILRSRFAGASKAALLEELRAAGYTGSGRLLDQFLAELSPLRSGRDADLTYERTSVGTARSEDAIRFKRAVRPERTAEPRFKGASAEVLSFPSRGRKPAGRVRGCEFHEATLHLAGGRAEVLVMVWPDPTDRPVLWTLADRRTRLLARAWTADPEVNERALEAAVHWCRAHGARLDSVELNHSLEDGPVVEAAARLGLRVQFRDPS